MTVIPESRIQVLPRDLSGLTRRVNLYDYQRYWIDDKSALKIATKSRRIGFSFAEGLDDCLSCLERDGHTVIVLSRGDRQSKEFIENSVAPHVRAANAVATFMDERIPETDIQSRVARFGNGSRIIALPANPDTARSYEGDVVLDEYAFHKDARKISEAIIPSITRGFRVKIISTPNGQQGIYYERAQECGLVDGLVTNKVWSAHKVTIADAIAQGFVDRHGRAIDLAMIRAACVDEEMWLQEYCCAFLSIATQWISPQLFQDNVSEDAVEGIPDWNLKGLFAGWDIARNKDLSVIWFLQVLGDVTRTVGVIELRNVPTPDQQKEAEMYLQHCTRMCVDKSGMGLAIYESLERKFAARVEGITFTLQSKEAMAVHAKRRMEARCARLPDSDIVRHSFRSVQKKVSNTGQTRFDAQHDAKYGHADHWWAYCLAEEAAGLPVQLGLNEKLKQMQEKQDQEKEAAKVQQSELQKPSTNPSTEACEKCGSTSIARIGAQKRCSQCGHTWGNVAAGADPAKRGGRLLK